MLDTYFCSSFLKAFKNYQIAKYTYTYKALYQNISKGRSNKHFPEHVNLFEGVNLIINMSVRPQGK